MQYHGGREEGLVYTLLVHLLCMGGGRRFRTVPVHYFIWAGGANNVFTNSIWALANPNWATTNIHLLEVCFCASLSVDSV